MSKLDTIKKFLESDNFAIAGVSRNDKKFGNLIYREMKSKGKKVFAVNPNISNIKDDACYPDIKSIPEKISSLIVLTQKNKTESVVNEAIQLGIKNIWIQKWSDTPEAVKSALDNGVNLIHKECVLMFMEPVKSFHSFHRFFSKLFGQYPK